MYKEAARWMTVRRVLMVVGVGVVSLPLVFVLWLLAAVRMPKMDTVTLKMPMGIRETVAESVYQGVPLGKPGMAGLARVIALEPENVQAWARLCQWERENESAQKNLENCKKALSLKKSAPTWNSMGVAQELSGDECAAEDSFTKAASEGSGGMDYTYVENFGRAALRCGKAYDARAGLSAAIDLETKNLKDADEDQIAGYRQDQLTDREYLIVTFDRLHDAGFAKSTCSDAHPDWKGCACSLDAKGKVGCVKAAK